MVKKVLSLIIISLLAAFAGFALLHPGLVPTHDGEYHVVRFYEFNKAFMDGNLYPRWAPDLNNGFGLPLFNYVYPLPNYIAVLFHVIGMSFIDAFKIEMFLSLVVGGIFFYLWAKQFWGEFGGMVSAIVFTFSPYRFVDIYIRGSVGECLALAIFPALLWSITVFIKTRNKIFFPISSLLFALLILSHNILALMFSVFLFLYVLCFIFQSKDRRKFILECSGILLLGLCASSVFWLPALLEKKFVLGLEIFDVASNFPMFYQLIIPTWGSGFSGAGIQDEISFQIGIANLCSIVLGIVGFFFIKKDNKIVNLFFIISSFVVIFLMLAPSLFLWQHIPLLNYFQFPWRLLSLEIIICSFLAGSVIRFKKLGKFVGLFLIILSVLLGIGYSKPAYYLDRTDVYYETHSNFIDGTNSPGNAFNTVWFAGQDKKTQKFSESDKSVTVNFSKISTSDYIARTNSLRSSNIIVNTAYFPGWNAYIDGKKVNTKITKEGLFSFSLPSGKHFLEVKLEDTFIRKISIIISIFSCAVLLSLMWSARIKGKHE